MAEVLLKELCNADIDWLVAVGQRRELATGTVLLPPNQDPDAVYLLLDGTLTVVVPRSDGTEVAVAEFTYGEMVGYTQLFNANALSAAVKASTPSVVLSIPSAVLRQKLQDVGFASRFYRAMALILSQYLQPLLQRSDRPHVMGNQPVKEALLVFGELRDSDLDWLTATGQVEKLSPGKILIHAGRPIDALYIVLDGLLSIAIPDKVSNSLSLCFECAEGLERNAQQQTEVASLSRGETAGIISFLDARAFPMTIRATKESLVLAVPRQQLAGKLQQDLGFAARFYRVLVIQLIHQLETVMVEFSGRSQTYQAQQDLGADSEYDDELDMESLEQVCQGANRFNWMLKRLGVV